MKTDIPINKLVLYKIKIKKRRKIFKYHVFFNYNNGKTTIDVVKIKNRAYKIPSQKGK